MNLPSVENAKLPASYQAAKLALAECTEIDECKDWADKADALASYAKQAKDDELQRYAQRIRARAARREGELWRQLDARGGDRSKKEDSRLFAGPSQKEMRDQIGVSEWHVKQSVRVSNIPEQDFDEQVEGPKPPTLSQLASQGTKPRQNIVDLQGRDPDEFNLAMHYVGGFERMAKDLEKEPHEKAIPILNEKERQRLRAAIQRIDAITDKTITRI